MTYYPRERQSTTQSLSAITQLVPSFYTIRVSGLGSAITITAIPAITEGLHNQVLEILGTSDTNTVTFESSSSLVLTNSAPIELGNGDTLQVKYLSDVGAWTEIARNVL